MAGVWLIITIVVSHYVVYGIANIFVLEMLKRSLVIASFYCSLYRGLSYGTVHLNWKGGVCIWKEDIRPYKFRNVEIWLQTKGKVWIRQKREKTHLQNEIFFQNHIHVFHKNTMYTQKLGNILLCGHSDIPTPIRLWRGWLRWLLRILEDSTWQVSILVWGVIVVVHTNILQII